MIKNRIVALDIGDKRIGVAVTDPFGEYAIPCETYFRKGVFSEDIKNVAEIVKGKGATEVVCGLPVNFDGSDSVQTEKTKRFIERLQEELNLPVHTEDERFTSVEAHRTQVESGVKLKDSKKTVDSIAASYILDGYLAKTKKAGEGEKKMENEEELDALDETLELEDEDGNTVRLNFLATIEYKGEKYCCFTDADADEEEAEVQIFHLTGDEQDRRLDVIEDDALLDEVFAEFCKEYEAYEDSDDAKKLDGED